MFGAYILQVANTFNGVLQGDITDIAKQVLPERFEGIYNNVIEYKKAVAPSRKETTEWHVPEFDMEDLDLFSNMNDDEPAPSIEDEVERIVNTENGAKLLDNSKVLKIGGTLLKRTFRKPGFNIEVRAKEEIK